VPAGGFTITEIIVALTVVALALAVAFPMFNKAPQNLGADLQDFTLNLQVAREIGVSRTIHYRVEITSQTAYALEAQSGGWATDRAVTLRPNVQFAAGDVGKTAEFDTRGLGVSPSVPVTFTLTDTARGWTKQVTVNTQGMVDHN
jgi:Tfp pilus assembly protein FimT